MRRAHGLNKRIAPPGIERCLVDGSRTFLSAYKKFIPAYPLLFLLVLPPGAHAAEDKSIGFVLEIVGDWTVNGTTLRLGQALPAGGEIKAVVGKSRFSSTNISVVLLNSRVVRLTCTRDKPCGSYRLPGSLVRSSSLAERISEAAINIFGRRPERYVPAIARSDKDAPQGFVETIVKLQDAKIGIGPLMKGLPEGWYTLSFNRVRESEAVPGDLPIVLEFRWSGEDRPVAVNLLSPGLYFLTLKARADSELPPITANCWVLVVSGRDYDRASDDLQRIRDEISSWEGISEVGRRSFLRLSLEFLSTQYK
jgi:hypothetical protein